MGGAEVLDGFEQGTVLRGGTFSGNPMACAALLATLEGLQASDYEALSARGEDLRAFIEATFAAQGITVATSGFGTVFSIWPSAAAPRTYEEASRMASPEFSKALHLALREAGVLVMPSPYGRLYLSFDHHEGVLREMKTAFARAAASLAAVFGKPAPGQRTDESASA